MFVPHITRKSGIFTKGFIKLSSQFIFSREQSTFVISYISLLHLELFFEKKKKYSTVVGTDTDKSFYSDFLLPL